MRIFVEREDDYTEYDNDFTLFGRVLHKVKRTHENVVSPNNTLLRKRAKRDNLIGKKISRKRDTKLF